MKSVRLGLIGLGNMGSGHADKISSGAVNRCDLIQHGMVADDLAGSFNK
jgi:3-hydroxyisobutyrate dehydrogenase-like beta-hydroxyacid dehydrogenase